VAAKPIPTQREKKLVPIQVLRCARRLAIAAFLAIGVWQAFWHHHDPPNWLAWLVLFVLSVTAYFLNRIIRDREGRFRAGEG
jgi:drug/metabolite transporter (DMT)-like permease